MSPSLSLHARGRGLIFSASATHAVSRARGVTTSSYNPVRMLKVIVYLKILKRLLQNQMMQQPFLHIIVI
jgi:hypothetical protein